MPRSSSRELVVFDPEIERTCRRLRRNKEMAEEIDGVRQDPPNPDPPNPNPQNPEPQGPPTIVETLLAQMRRLELMVEAQANPQVTPVRVETAMQRYQATSPIVLANVATNDFTIPHHLLHSVRNEAFRGFPTESPHKHIDELEQKLVTLKIPGVTNEGILLRIFPFSLKDNALIWFQSLPARSIYTWDDMVSLFITKFFPISKVKILRDKIREFQQYEDETLPEAWERFMGLLRDCPQHEFTKSQQSEIFYDGVLTEFRNRLDGVAGGSLLRLGVEHVWSKIEEMVEQDLRYAKVRDTRRRIASIQDSGVNAEISKRLGNLERAIMGKNINYWCSHCGEEHDDAYCPDFNTGRSEGLKADVNFVGNRGVYQHHQGINPHPNLSYANPNNAANPVDSGAQQRAPFQQAQYNRQGDNSGRKSFYEYISSTFEKYEALHKKHEAHQAATDAKLGDILKLLKNMEVQISQVANTVAGRAPGTMPSNTDVNPREHVNMVTTRGGKTAKSGSPSVLHFTPTRNTQVHADASQRPGVPDSHADASRRGGVPVSHADALNAEEETEEEVLEQPKVYKPFVPVEVRMPFPQARKKKEDDVQFTSFLTMLKQIHINLPFIDVLTQMPKYAKFLKECLSNKRKWKAHETIELKREVSAILQGNLPPKLEDQGSFNIPCTIGSIFVKKALCDLGASINVMPYSLFRKLRLGEPKPTSITLQLADKSIKHPRGIIEDVLIKVNHFVFPVDFIVLDMEEDREETLILGRPFLATGNAVINVAKGKLSLSVGGETITFDVYNDMKSPINNHTCMKIDATNPMSVEKVIENRVTFDAKATYMEVTPPSRIIWEVDKNGSYAVLRRNKPRTKWRILYTIHPLYKEREIVRGAEQLHGDMKDESLNEDIVVLNGPPI